MDHLPIAGASQHGVMPSGLGGRLAEQRQYAASTYAGAKEAVDRPVGSIEREVDAYATNLDTFERLLTTLAGRIAHVSASPNPDSRPPGNTTSKAVATPRSPLGATLQDKNLRFEGLLEALAFFTDRIDL
jgi:hypothetical protein